MGFNYGRERKKFEMDFAKEHVEYVKNGMSESAINDIYKFDLDEFNVNRTYATRNRSLIPDYFDEQDDALDKLPFTNRFGTAYEPDVKLTSRYSWKDEIENLTLIKSIKKLSIHELELVTLMMEGYTQCEIAEIHSVSQVAIFKKIRKVKNIFNNF